MTKFQPIVLSLVFAYASAAGCFPAYSAGGSFSVGSSVSSAITTTTPVVYTACTVSPTCLTGYVQTGGVTTTTSYNFVCKSNDWCNNVGYAPGGTYSDLAWTKEAASCSVSSPADSDAHRLFSSSSCVVVVERRRVRRGLILRIRRPCLTRLTLPRPPLPLPGTPYLTLHDTISSKSFRGFFLFARLSLLNVSSSSVSAMESSGKKSP